MLYQVIIDTIRTIMMKPEVPLNWEPNKQRFVGLYVDPSGVQTEWEMLPAKKVAIRTDRLTNLGFERRVWDNEQSEKSGLFSNLTMLDVYDTRRTNRKHVGVWLYKGSGRLSASLSLNHLQGDFDFFNVSYGSDGQFHSLMFNDGLQPGTGPMWPEAKDKQDIESRPFDDCFNELVQIAKTNGLTTFCDMGGKSMWAKEEPTVDLIRMVAMAGILTHYEDYIPREKVPEYLEIAHKYAAVELGTRFEEDEFIRNNGEVVSLLLALQTVEQYAEDRPNLTEPFSEKVKGAFEKTIRYLLRDYYAHLQRSGQSMISFGYDDKKKLTFLVGGMVSLMDPIRKEEVNFGDSLQHDEYTFTFRRAYETNRLELVIGNILKPSVYRRFYFPETVDAPKIYEVVSVPERTGWEGALELVPFDYK